ncbi:hypothetical protein [Hyphobacterium sp.]|uniref:hypothetical protein n=1 Tax=Hyphobacterium sp. TaxID=2004662 RepID=UPI003B51C919
MKRIYLMGAALLVAACAQETEQDSVDDVEAVNGEYETGYIDDSEGGPEDEEAFDELVEARSIDGRWGVQYETCSEDNESGDGVILISRYDVIMGMDACSIAGVTEVDGIYEIDGMCDGTEGAYEYTFYFSSPQEGVLRWDNRELDRVEDYVSCDGGAMH